MSRRARTDAQALLAEAPDIKSIAGLLRCIKFSHLARVLVSDAGLKVTTELDRTLQAHAYLSAALFTNYVFRPPSTASRSVDVEDDAERADSQEPPSILFEVNLQTLLSCLDVFGGAPALRSEAPGSIERRSAFAGRRKVDMYQNDGAAEYRDREPHRKTDATALKLTYKQDGCPLVLLLEEQQVITRSEISTFDPTDDEDMAFDNDRLAGQAILSSALFLDALQTIDPSSKNLSLHFSVTGGPASSSVSDSNASSLRSDRNRKPGMLHISADGDFGRIEMDFPNDPGVMEKFSCLYDFHFSYRYSLFQHMRHALQASLKTSIRVNDEGLASFQFLMPRGTGSDNLRGGSTGAARSKTSAVASGHGFVEMLLCPLEAESE